MRTRARLLFAGLIALAGLAASGLTAPPALAAQTLRELTATPESTATLFLRSVRAIRWTTTAQLLHERTLRRFHDVIGYLIDTDSTGALRKEFTGTETAEAYQALAPEAAFTRAVGRMVDQMPGLMHTLFDHDDDVIGHVMEGSDTAHVVYRTIERLGGARPEVRVIQMAHTPDGWRVLWSDELEILDAALDGIPRSRRPPPGGMMPRRRDPASRTSPTTPHVP